MATPKPAFYVTATLIIAGLAGFAFWRYGDTTEATDPTKVATISKEDLKALQGHAEDPSQKGSITTVKEYSFVPGEKLPDVKGVSNYDPLVGDVPTVRQAINVWAGWAPIIHANQGFKPGKTWVTEGGDKFKVELVLIDDPVAMRDAFAAGNIHIGWGTVDMLPLFLESLRRDPRTMPRIFQQIDWSNGGDGIVTRNSVKTVADLKGKKMVLAQNSPSQFFALHALINAGVQPAEVDFTFTADAFQAAAAFAADSTIDAVVSWAPDIYNLSEASGNRMLVSTETANKLISDVWYARADFAKDHPDIIEALVRGNFDSMDTLQSDEGKDQVSQWMAQGYSMPVEEAKSMLGDAHWTNYAENRAFFMDANNPTNFERTYDTAFFLYKNLYTSPDNEVVTSKVPFDQLVDFSVIAKLGDVPKYAAQKDEYQINFLPTSAESIQVEKNEILTKTIVLRFCPESYDIWAIRMDTKKPCDENAERVIEEIGVLAGQYSAAHVVIEGHTDSSMKGRVPVSKVKNLSNNRAAAIKQELVRRFNLAPNQFSTSGLGWDRPADPNDPFNQEKNRRVEIKVYPLEAQ